MNDPRNPWDVGFELQQNGIALWRYGFDVEVFGTAPDLVARFRKQQPTAAALLVGAATAAKTQRDKYNGQYPLNFDITSAMTAALDPNVSQRDLEELYTQLALGWEMWNDEQDRGRWSG